MDACMRHTEQDPHSHGIAPTFSSGSSVSGESAPEVAGAWDRRPGTEQRTAAAPQAPASADAGPQGGVCTLGGVSGGQQPRTGTDALACMLRQRDELEQLLAAYLAAQETAGRGAGAPKAGAAAEHLMAQASSILARSHAILEASRGVVPSGPAQRAALHSALLAAQAGLDMCSGKLLCATVLLDGRPHNQQQEREWELQRQQQQQAGQQGPELPRPPRMQAQQQGAPATAGAGLQQPAPAGRPSHQDAQQRLLLLAARRHQRDEELRDTGSSRWAAAADAAVAAL